MSSWHVEDRDLRRWLAHNTALATSVSIEQHLVSCDGCIDRVGALARQDSALDAEMEHGWERVRDAVELHRPSWLERGLTTVGLPAHEAQLVAAARAFRGPLLVAVLVVLVFAELAGQFGQARGEFFFLLVAPLLPSAAVAFGYDPTWSRHSSRSCARRTRRRGWSFCAPSPCSPWRFRSRCCSGWCCPGRSHSCGCCRPRDSWPPILLCRRGSARYAASPSSPGCGR